MPRVKVGLKSKPKPSSDECSSTFSSDLEDMFGMTKGDTNNSSKTSTCFETVPDKDLITASGDNLAESRALRRKRSPATREYIKKTYHRDSDSDSDSSSETAKPKSKRLNHNNDPKMAKVHAYLAPTVKNLNSEMKKESIAVKQSSNQMQGKYSICSYL